MSVPRRRIVPVALVMVTALVLGACSSSASKSRLRRRRSSTSRTRLRRRSRPAGASGRCTSPARPRARTCSSCNADGEVVAHAPADAHGSLIFRDVPVAPGYRVAAGSGVDARRERRARRDVVDHAAARVVLRGAEDRQRLRLPAHARRHHAVDDRAPSRAGRQGSVPDGDRVLRLLAGRPEVAAAEHADRPGARLRDGRHQHARHRLLRRRVQLLRAAAVDRRVRRDRDDRRAAVGRAPQGRDGRPLVPGDQRSCSWRSSARRTSRRSRRCR